ncbi:uncharacterized protein AKAME5_000877800 [Lates japonicus]|uniref:Uncharacterized protein n=1 Tax=Lates japonicus TaxID=270547 RepID=A0AAD3R415_LATJO|nr:uncharacterized protein AKAME5_000877800 [Lates japonicus]
MPECDVTNVLENEGEEEIKGMEERADTDDVMRRPERNRQPPRRLDYAELGNPVVTAVKSLFQGLTTAWNDIISESEASARPRSVPSSDNHLNIAMHRDVHEFGGESVTHLGS